MQALCRLDDINDQHSKGFELGEIQVFAIRQGDQVHTYHNHCPHLGIPLEWLPDKFLDVEGELIQCSTHGALFTIEEGLCVSGPCSGKSLKTIASQVVDGTVFIDLQAL